MTSANGYLAFLFLKGMNVKKVSRLFGIAALACVTVVTTCAAASAAEAKLPKSATDEKPIYENWAEEVPNGQIVVAKDGSVLIFKGYTTGPTEPNYINVKRSEDGGKTWSKEEKVGDTVKVDGDMSDAGRYPNNNWTHLGNVTVDETTGDIMVFLSTLKTAQKLYRSTDNGKTWKFEDTTIKPGKDGWMPATIRGWPSVVRERRAKTWFTFWREKTGVPGLIWPGCSPTTKTDRLSRNS